MAPDTAPSHDTKKPLATHDWKVVLVPVRQHTRFIYQFKADEKSYPSVPSRPKTGRVVVTESTIQVRCLVFTTRWIDVIYRVKARAIFNLRKLIGERWIFESYYSYVNFLILRLTLCSVRPFWKRGLAVKLLNLNFSMAPIKVWSSKISPTCRGQFHIIFIFNLDHRTCVDF